jgi:hypothetical protein
LGKANDPQVVTAHTKNLSMAINKVLDAIGRKDNDSKQLGDIYITRGEVSHTISNKDNYYTSDFINLLLYAFKQETLSIQAYSSMIVDKVQEYFVQFESSDKDYSFISLNVAYDEKEPQHKNHWAALPHSCIINALFMKKTLLNSAKT